MGVGTEIRDDVSGWLAMDIGGANLKLAHGLGPSRSVPFAVWKAPGQLADAIAAACKEMPPSRRLFVTMTAELCDCYETKTSGVLAILEAVRDALPRAIVSVWGLDGRFHSMPAIHEVPRLAAAANWLALAMATARLVPESTGLLIDIGTTTTDLIPFREGRVVAQGRTDTERLLSGELVYAGHIRTPLCALATDLPFRGQTIGLAAELFATTRDVYLLLGEIAPDPSDVDTADGRPATPHFARDRLARMVGADRDDFSEADARELASAFDIALRQRLEAAISQVCASTIGPPAIVIVAGSGEYLARKLAGSAMESDGRIVGLSEAWGRPDSVAACARALLFLAEKFSSETSALG